MQDETCSLFFLKIDRMLFYFGVRGREYGVDYGPWNLTSTGYMGKKKAKNNQGDDRIWELLVVAKVDPHQSDRRP